MLDLSPSQATFWRDVRRGLTDSPRTLPSKYFYDAAGSRLFDQICTLPEYYLGRTESALLDAFGDEIAHSLGPGCAVIEYGAVSGRKTLLLLDALREPYVYVAVNICRAHLARSVEALRHERPTLAMLPVCADFSRPFEIPPLGANRGVVFFPGSTIGNFTPRAARSLLRRTARLAGPGGWLVLGADLQKGRTRLEAAYNDALGVTAAFNKNILARINREFGGTFDLDGFTHRAVYNEALARIEMYLVSRRRQRVRVRNLTLELAAGEPILTEWSYKYTRRDIAHLAQGSFVLRQSWVDAERLFGVFLLECRT